ncbi:gamma-glutamyltransferase family protein [Nesterenkonia natronophila]|uniref:Gamma-glutamyltransferase family protein n=1 Tax=Nesterenkonia natronophila TaxID=2174932 RepID=A0A3A4F442_9MICC|nr:gamma-glutamyltransferase family protein [Nesterenkonia natronophila]RJN32586.1 gamma-glutamyltransferase family protein [Nesterenkonia natronophila]
MHESTRPELLGDFGMVASTHWLASQTGMSILERGGNAADAAAASGFALQVLEPHLNGPGGEVPILVWSETDQKVEVINGQGTAPQAATVKRLKEMGLDIMPGTGLLSAVVPGAFGAWLTLLERHGSMSLREILSPAIRFAEKGHPVLGRVSRTIETVQELFAQEWPTSAATWLPGGEVPAPNTRFRNTVLARTYTRLVEEAEAAGSRREAQLDAAQRAWYSGFVAEAIESFCRDNHVKDTSGRRNPGLLTGQDLAGWQAQVEEPATLDYQNYTVCKTGPWGQGPVMLQQLAMLESYGLDSAPAGSADWVHGIVETGKLAFADREAWYGDPRFTDVPLQDLLSPEYARQRRTLIDDATASRELRPGAPGGRQPQLPQYPAASAGGETAGVGEPTVAHNGDTRGDTCHVDVVDSGGMMVAATPSGGWLQASPTIPELGFCLSSRAQMFWLQEGLPNSLRPGARPRTTLSPSFALRDGKPWMAFGTPGGDSQDQWNLQLFLNVVHGGMNLQEAIDAPALHSTHIPSSFYPRESFPAQVMIEDRFPTAVLDELARRGHDLKIGGPWTEGRLSAVSKEGEWLRAGANPRGAQGYAVGR